MSNPNKQLQHWHIVKNTTSQRLKNIHNGTAPTKDVKRKEGLRQLLKQAKIFFSKHK